MDVIEQLKRDEGVRNKPYIDTVGKTTIGVGRNLTDVGIFDDEVDYLLKNDVKRTLDVLTQFPWFVAMDPVRKGAIVNMAFNLGVSGLLHFPMMLHCLSLQDWSGAAAAMRDSLWAKQVGPRAERLEQQVLTGKWV